jgi:hypothetical protein
MERLYSSLPQNDWANINHSRKYFDLILLAVSMNLFRQNLSATGYQSWTVT